MGRQPWRRREDEKGPYALTYEQDVLLDVWQRSSSTVGGWTRNDVKHNVTLAVRPRRAGARGRTLPTQPRTSNPSSFRVGMKACLLKVRW